MELSETAKTLLTQFTDEVIGMLLAILAFLFLILFVYRLHIRRRLRNFFHQIPASEVKNYLDSIISNGHALRSSFSYREGFDLENRTPSVMPLTNLPLNGANSEANVPSEELGQRDAEIASLKSQIGEKNKTMRELEEMLATARESQDGDSGQEEKLKNEVATLKAQLDQASQSSNNDESETKLQNMVQERDQLKERLDAYELIEEDLANLKRFQEENQKLKAEIEGFRNRPEVANPTPQTAPEENISQGPSSPGESASVAQSVPPEQEQANVAKGQPLEEQASAQLPQEELAKEEPIAVAEGAPLKEDVPVKVAQELTPEEESLKRVLDVTETIDTPTTIVKGGEAEVEPEMVHRVSGGGDAQVPEESGQIPDNSADGAGEDSEAKSLDQALNENIVDNLDDQAIEDLKSDDLEKGEPEVPANEGNQKSAEELLSEFEKMLG